MKTKMLAKVLERIDAWPPAFGVEVSRPFTNEAQVKRRLKVAVEVAGGHELFQRDGNWFVTAARFYRAEHGAPPEGGGFGKTRSLPLAMPEGADFFNTQSPAWNRFHDLFGCARDAGDVRRWRVACS